MTNMRRNERKVTDIAEIKAFLDECKVCRVAFSGEDAPYIVPMNMAYDLEDGKLSLYFHCASEGRKIDLLTRNPKVGFEMDREIGIVEGKLPCQYSYRYMSIIGSGNAFLVEDETEKVRILTKIMKQQSGKDFDDFEKNPKLTKVVTIIRVDAREYFCKRNG